MTLAAAEAYATFARLPIEQARREVTALLLDAQMQDSEGGTLRYRWRKSGRGDIGAHVAEQDGLMVVVHLRCRPA